MFVCMCVRAVLLGSMGRPIARLLAAPVLDPGAVQITARLSFAPLQGKEFACIPLDRCRAISKRKL